MNTINHQSPTRSRERIEFVDILRGFALIGVLLMNMHAYSGHAFELPQIAGRFDRLTVILQQFLLQAKFYSLFSLLFGWGLAAQFARSRSRGTGFVPYYLRRNSILLVIGLIHAILIWDGDILVMYALLAFLLLLFRNRSPQTILLSAAACLILSVVMVLPGETMDLVRTRYTELTSFLRTDALPYQLYATGSYREVLGLRVDRFLGMLANFLYWFGNIFSMFLLGFYIGKRELFKNYRQHLPLIRRVMWIGLILGLIFNGIFLKTNLQPSWVPSGYQRLAAAGARTIGAPALMLFYVSALILLLRKESWHSRLSQLAPVGRMALTNYLAQSVICTLIFYGYGLGLYGQISPTAGMILSGFVFLGQIRFSAYWLGRYRFGPVEWAWRSLAYGKLQRLRQGEPDPERRSSWLDKTIRGLKKIPQQAALLGVWVILLAWAAGLIFWNRQMISQGYYEPFTFVVRVTPTPPGEAAGDPGSRSEQTSIATPVVEPVNFEPGPLTASGDMVSLAGALDVQTAMTHIERLADPEFAGRYAGTPGGFAAGNYIAQQFAAYGLQPAGDDGTFFQSFPVFINQLSEIPVLAVEGDHGLYREAVLYQEFAPVTSPYLGAGETRGPIFWGDLCTADMLQEHDLVGKVLLCREVTAYEDILTTGRLALEYGAAGLLLLTDADVRPPDFGSRYYLPWVPETIPAFRVYPDLMDEILSGTGYQLEDVLDSLPPLELETSARIKLETSGAAACPTAGCTARNVLGVIPGRDPAHADEVILISGHYDHMGASPDGTIWYGAEDNASGISVLLEIARSWQEQGYVPRRTVVFAAWDAEELGLLGSRYYVDHPRYALEDTTALIQLDMVGAGAEYLTVSGTGRLKSQILSTAELLSVPAEGADLARSDHIPFWEAGVPASLLIWWEEETTDFLHRPNDTIAVIEADQLALAARIANLTVLNLAENEPAILEMLEERELAVESGDRRAFLATSRNDQRAIDQVWFDDLQDLNPAELELTAEDIRVQGDRAAARIGIRVVPADTGSGEAENQAAVRSAELAVRFERGSRGWLWAGPDLVQSAGDDTHPGFQVFIPPGEEELPRLGTSAHEDYTAIAARLGLPSTADTAIFLLPSADDLRTNVSLSLPREINSWVAPGKIYLVYDPEIANSASLSTALAQLVLAEAGIPHRALPWLWEGLPLLLQAEEDPYGVQSSLIPDLTAALEIDPSASAVNFKSGELSSSPINNRSPGDNLEEYFSATSWAAVDTLLGDYGWSGLGMVIKRFGESCSASGCRSEADLEAAYQNALNQDKAEFEESWQQHWTAELEFVQSRLDELLLIRMESALEGDRDAFLGTVDPSVSNLKTAENSWFTYLTAYPPDELTIMARPLALSRDGQVVAAVEMEVRRAGKTNRASYPILFSMTGSSPRWKGAPLEVVVGNGAAVRYPAGLEMLAREYLAEIEAELTAISTALEITPTRRMILEIYDDPDSYRSSIFFTYPLTEYTSSWTDAGENIKLYLASGTEDADALEIQKSELATQVARWLMADAGIDSEWLLKGISSLLTRPVDGGLTYQEIGAAYPDLQIMLEEGTLPHISALKKDYQIDRDDLNAVRAVALDSVRCLVETYGWEALLDLIGSYQQNKDLDSALRFGVGVSLIDFEEDWRQSLSAGYTRPEWSVFQEAVSADSGLVQIDRLAGEEMAGRQAGTPGGQFAREYIAGQFAAYGLLPAGDPDSSSYFQDFEITTRILNSAPIFEILGADSPQFFFREDFIPLAALVPEAEQARGELVWVEDYQALGPGDSLTGKIVVRPALDDMDLEIEQAVSRGVIGVVVVGAASSEQVYAKQPEIFAFSLESPIPIFKLTLSGTRKLLEAADSPAPSFSGLPAFSSLAISGKLQFNLPAEETLPTANVLGVLPGSDPYLKEEVLILGAHYDHVGHDPGDGFKYSGRNDDASGIAGLLEIARIWNELGYQPKRTVLFAAWGAQELEQAGSTFYVNNPLYPLGDMIGVVQLDGIAGGDGFYTGVQGEWEKDGQLLFRVRSDEKIVVTPQLTPSDHFSFGDYPIPTLLVNWRLADEDNLPDQFTNQVSPNKFEHSLKMVIRMVMAVCQ